MLGLLKMIDKTLDGSLIIENFGQYENKISLARLIEKANVQDLTKVYVELSYMSYKDPYNQDPYLLLTGDIDAPLETNK